MYKELILFSGRDENARWVARQRIRRDGHSLFSDFHQEDVKKGAIRNSDMGYFRRNIGNFLKGKHIHHDWNNGAQCYIIEREKHFELHSGMKQRRSGK